MGYELIHDTIAKQIFAKASSESQTRRKIEKSIRERHQDFLERGAELSQKDLDYFTSFLSQVNISPEELAFLDDSRKKLDRANKKKQRLTGFIIASLSGLLILSWVMWGNAQRQRSIAENKTMEALKSDSIAQVQRDAARLAQSRAEKSEAVAEAQANIARLERNNAEQERNNARQQADRAIKAQKRAEALTMASLARELPVQNMPTALRISQAAYEHTAPEAPPPAVYQTLAGTFFQQFAGEGVPANYLPVLSIPQGNGILAPSGRYILTSEEHEASLWDQKGKLIHPLKGHTGTIRSKIFSPNEQLILTCAEEDPVAKIWDSRGIWQADLQHEGEVNSAVFSPDGKYLLTASADGTAKLWDQNGALLKTFSEHQGAVNFAIFSPGGNYILTGSEDKTAMLRTPQGAVLATLGDHSNGLKSAVFSPDEQLIVTLPNYGRSAKLWEIDGSPLPDIGGHNYSIAAIEFSSDSEFLITGSHDEDVTIWDRSGKERHRLRHTSNNVNGTMYSTAIAPDNSKILVSTKLRGGTVLWDTTENQLLQFEGGPSTFSPDGNRILTQSGIWDLNGNKLINLKAGDHPTFSENGQLVLSTSKQQTQLWDLRGALVRDIAHLPASEINSRIDLTIAPDGQFMVTQYEDKWFTVWDSEGDSIFTRNGTLKGIDKNSRYLFSKTNQEINIWDPAGKSLGNLQTPEYIYGTTIAPDGQRLVISYQYDPPQLWDWQSDAEPLELDEYPTDVVAFSADGAYFTTYSAEYRSASLWDNQGNPKLEISGGRKFKELADGTKIVENKGRLSGVRPAPNGKYVLAIYSNAAPSLLDLTGKEIAVLQLPGTQPEANETYFATYSPNGKYIVTNRRHQDYLLWTAEGKFLRALKNSAGESNYPKFSPDSRYIANSKGLWEVSGKYIAPLTEHGGSLIDFSFSPDSKYVRTLTSGQVNLWNTKGELLAAMAEPGDDDGIKNAIFSTDSQFLLTSSQKGFVRLWPVPERIYQYLRGEAGIPALSADQKERYGIN